VQRDGMQRAGMQHDIAVQHHELIAVVQRGDMRPNPALRTIPRPTRSRRVSRAGPCGRAAVPPHPTLAYKFTRGAPTRERKRRCSVTARPSPRQEGEEEEEGAQEGGVDGGAVSAWPLYAGPLQAAGRRLPRLSYYIRCTRCGGGSRRYSCRYSSTLFDLIIYTAVVVQLYPDIGTYGIWYRSTAAVHACTQLYVYVG
jgi:hypothetical protein